MQHVELTQRMLHFVTGPLETTHIGTLTLASNSFRLRCPQVRYQTDALLLRGKRLGIGLDHRHAMFFTDDVDDS